MFALSGVVLLNKSFGFCVWISESFYRALCADIIIVSKVLVLL